MAASIPVAFSIKVVIRPNLAQLPRSHKLGHTQASRVLDVGACYWGLKSSCQPAQKERNRVSHPYCVNCVQVSVYASMREMTCNTCACLSTHVFLYVFMCLYVCVCLWPCVLKLPHMCQAQLCISFSIFWFVLPPGLFRLFYQSVQGNYV